MIRHPATLMLKLRAIALWLCVWAGLLSCAVCLCYALGDWALLQKAQHEFERVASSKDASAILAAATKQSIHRINIFAEVVWALQSATLAAIGAHGLRP